MQEQVTEEDILNREQELVEELIKLRKLRGMRKEPEVIDAEYKRLDPDTGEETSILDDLGQIGFREVLIDPKNPTATVGFLKNLQQRPDLIKKAKKQLSSEDFLEKVLITSGGAILGWYLRGKYNSFKNSK